MAAIGFFAIFLATLTVLWRADSAVPEVADPAGLFVVGGLDLSAVNTMPVSDADRAVYQDSIVPGGVRSAAEVMRAMDRDPVVAAHYANVDPIALRRAQLEAPALAHVSYRIGDQVYFTAKKLRLKAGEPVLTDGQTTIREKCGNIISVQPIAPTSPKEPPADQLDVVVAPAAPPAQVTARGTPAFNVPSTAVPLTNTPPSGTTPPIGGFPPGDPSLRGFRCLRRLRP